MVYSISKSQTDISGFLALSLDLHLRSVWICERWVSVGTGLFLSIRDRFFMPFRDINCRLILDRSSTNTWLLLAFLFLLRDRSAIFSINKIRPIQQSGIRTVNIYADYVSNNRDMSPFRDYHGRTILGSGWTRIGMHCEYRSHVCQTDNVKTWPTFGLG